MRTKIFNTHFRASYPISDVQTGQWMASASVSCIPFIRRRVKGVASVRSVLQLEETELQEMIGEAIDNLPEKYKTPVTLFYVQEMSYEQIGEVLNVPLGTVKTDLFRGRNLLREYVLARLKKEEVKVA